MSILRTVARRCEVHGRPSWRKITELEAEIGFASVMGEPRNFIERFDDPDLCDCGHHWCRQRRGLA